MKGSAPIDEVESEVTNVYRTDKYIVYQSVHVCYGKETNILISDDVFYLRTPKRDKAYEEVFGEGGLFSKRKRMKVAAYTRRYID